MRGRGGGGSTEGKVEGGNVRREVVTLNGGGVWSVGVLDGVCDVLGRTGREGRGPGGGNHAEEGKEGGEEGRE